MLGTRLGDYTIQALLGRGGMARVYRGLDENLGRPAAVKVLRISPEDADEVSKTAVDRFRREARTIASFDHRNIITVFQFGEQRGLFFIAMKLVEGDTLAHRLRDASRQGRRLPPGQVLHMVEGVAAALDYAHERNIIHRDVKPSNILLDAEDRVILTDFGLVLELDTGSTLGMAFGTPRYISPEQAVASQSAVPQSDIYSLGVITFELLTGKVPFEGDSPMGTAVHHITTPAPNPRAFNSDIPVEVAEVVLRALEKEPENRYPTAGEFAAALRAAFYPPEDPQSETMLLPQALASGAGPETLPLVDALPAPSPALPRAVESAAAGDRLAIPPPPGRKIDATPAVAPPFEAPLRSIPPMLPTRPHPQLSRKPRRRRRPLILGLLILIMAAVAVALAGLGGPEGLAALIGAGTGQGTAGGQDQPSPSPVDTLTPVPPGAGMRVQLGYNATSFTLYNPNDAPLDVSGITLVRGAGEDRLVYEGTYFHGPLPPRQCARIYLSEAVLRLPVYCPNPMHSQAMLSDPSARFWVPGPGGGAGFQVMLGEEVLAACGFEVERCIFTLPAP